MRINKYLASCNLGSRRKVEELVMQGKVKINGKVVKDLAFDVSNDDVVEFEDRVITPVSDYTYIMLHKPKGYVTTTNDDKGRKIVMDLLPQEYKNLKPIGRLDYDSEGLLLLTNDGDLSFALTHPSHEIGKVYVVKIEGEIQESQLAVLRSGVVVEGVRLAKCKVKKLECKDRITKLEMTIYEGKNRQIRKMFEAVGFKVIFLKRTQIGELRLSGVNRGSYRLLKQAEINYLKSL